MKVLEHLFYSTLLCRHGAHNRGRNVQLMIPQNRSYMHYFIVSMSPTFLRCSASADFTLLREVSLSVQHWYVWPELYSIDFDLIKGISDERGTLRACATLHNILNKSCNSKPFPLFSWPKSWFDNRILVLCNEVRDDWNALLFISVWEVTGAHQSRVQTSDGLHWVVIALVAQKKMKRTESLSSVS